MSGVASLTELGLIDQARSVADGACTPGELFEATAERARALDEATNCLSGVFDGDLEAELNGLEAGPLYGVPCGVKDMFALSWRAAHDGAPRPGPADKAGSSGVQRRLRTAGALPLFSTNMHQLGIGTTSVVTASGPIRNPWNLDRCAGGSSGGSGVVVAGRALSGAVGTDAAGSIRVPASFCGITGLKLTWGAVPVDGYRGSYSTMGAIGPMTRDAGDCRVLAEALTGRRLETRTGQLRLGVPARSHWHDVEDSVLERCKEAVEVLRRAGISVREVEISGAEHISLAAMVMTGAERLPEFEPEWIESVFPTLEPAVRGLLKSRFMLSASLLARVMRFRSMLRRAAAELFGCVDLVAMPTSPVSPPGVERPRAELPSGSTSPDAALLPYVGWANLCGVPAISVPCGFDSAEMPVGLTLHAAWGREDLLLDVAERFERLTDRDHVDRRPPCPAIT